MNRQRCLFCQGELELQRVSRAQEYEGRWFVIENLPALVCRQCGERFYPDVHDLEAVMHFGRWAVPVLAPHPRSFPHKGGRTKPVLAPSLRLRGGRGRGMGGLYPAEVHNTL